MRALSRRLPMATLALGLGLACAPVTAGAADLTIDDRALVATGSWAKVSAKTATEKTLLRSKKKAATLSSKVAATDGGSVVFQVGAGRGTATISVAGKKRATVRTSAKKKTFKIVKFSGAGTVKVAVTKQGSGVYVDAVVLTGLGTTPPNGFIPGPNQSTPTPGPGAGPGPGSVTPPSPVNLGPLTEVDTSAAGAGGNGSDLTNVAVAPNGQSVAFWSTSTNLVPGVTDGRPHLYLKTLASGAIRILDQAQNGTVGIDNGYTSERRGVAWKPDSSEVLFTTQATNLGPNTAGYTAPFLYSKDVTDNSVGLIADRATPDLAWSPDGTKIVFGSTGIYCAPQPTCSAAIEGSATRLYLWDIGPDEIYPVSATQAGEQAAGPGLISSANPVWSSDSKRIAFESYARNLVAGDTNQVSDVFVKDATTATITRVSTSPTGAQGNGNSRWPSFSPDGTKLAFDSKSDFFAAGDNNSGEDIFVKDLASGAISAISTTPAGEFKLFSHTVPRWSPDGTKIAFRSQSVDLIDGYVDANDRDDVYVKTLATGRFQIVSARADGVIGNARSDLWDVANCWLPDSHSLVFKSYSSNLSPSDGNNFGDSVFIKGGL